MRQGDIQLFPCLQREHYVSQSHVLLTTSQTATHMEALGHQQEEGERRRILEEALVTDRETDLVQFASPDFVRQVVENRLTENDQKVVSIMMQKARQLHT